MNDLSLTQAALKVEVEPFLNVYLDAQALMELHWEEIAKNKHLLTINPDIDRYKSLDDRGMLLAVSARASEQLVGYLVWIMTVHPHYKHVVVAEDDLHFLSQEYRQGLAGFRFLKQAIAFAKVAGAQMIVMREKFDHQHPALMERLGFAATDIVYTQVVG